MHWANPSTDQLAMGSSMAGNMACQFTLEVVARDTTTDLTVGVYSTTEATPILCPLLSGGFRKAWYDVCHVIRDTMVVATFLGPGEDAVPVARAPGPFAGRGSAAEVLVEELDHPGLERVLGANHA